jgi:glycosyltransferase involved in cell wall biosynthesis
MPENNADRKRPVILIFADYYLPGYKSGGGMRTIVNMVDRLDERYDFRIVTRDHDGKLDKTRYTDVVINAWNDVRGAKVFYLSKDNVRISKLRELILEVGPDSIYLNSFFATLAIYVLKLRKLKLIPYRKIILAPCGELSEGALRLKPAKKRVFINIAKMTGLYKDVIWKPSNELEHAEIERLKPQAAKYFVAPDMPPVRIFENYRQDAKPRKESGSVRMVFLSRFMRKKNFRWLLENLGEIDGRLSVDIFGPLEDSEYWHECERLIEDLPDNLKIRAHGSIPHERVLATLFEYHFFIMPTLGENFGHIFLEALAGGCPLIISDRTPWRKLAEAGIGWDLPLEKPSEWNRIINRAVRMDQAEYRRLSENSRTYLNRWLENVEIEKDTVRVLEYSLK